MSEEHEELIREIENLLDLYTVEEILELADITPSHALFLLVSSGEIELPETRPV